MPVDPIRATIRQVDMSDRVAFSSTVVASPAAAAETIIASVTLAQGVPIVSGVLLFGWATYTVGTNGVSGRLRVRQTDVNGATKIDTGLLTRTAAQLVDDSVLGFDAAPADGQIYKLTLIVGSGSAISTVSAVGLLAIPV